MAKSYSDDPDVLLMLQVVQGDRFAFEKLVTKYQRIVMTAAFRYTGNPGVAEELAQDVFVRVFRASHSYKPEARFSTWLFTIVRNVCSNYRSREGKYDHKTDSEIDPSFPGTQESQERELINSERDQKIRDAIRGLPDALRLPLILHQFNHLSYDEIAKILEISLATVKIRIHRARLALVDALREFA